jgi:UDP-N-acetylglucosamine transferase subunit ALG13
METFRNEKDPVQGESPLIFVVTGTQEPFDRMIKIVDNWASKQVKYKVIAQTAKSTLITQTIECVDFLEPEKFNNIFNKASVIIGHAGMGTIIKSLENKKKIIVFPRSTKYGEHRNDHQHYTAKSFDELGYVQVAYTSDELSNCLNNLESLKVKKTDSFKVDEELLEGISEFIKNN